MDALKEDSLSRELPLEELLKGITSRSLEGKRSTGVTVRMVTSDSREVVPGSLFVAVRGYCADGHRFIESAVKRGAVAVVCEELPAETSPDSLYITVSDARIALGEAARIFYGKASDRLQIIGVTGTNGKTTTAKLITAMLNANGIASGYIGTNLCRIGDREILLDRTTPEAHGLHSLFTEMLEAGCRAVVMEVSSHALVLKRVYGIRFHAAVFTNLTMEHLDFHNSMHEYALAKQLLFDQLAPDGFAVLNSDDHYAREMAVRVEKEKIYCCSLQKSGNPPLTCRVRFTADIIESSIAGSAIALHFPDALVHMKVRLPGIFNVMNVLEAAAVGAGMGIAPEAICRSLSDVDAVDGRMERVGDGGTGWSAFVDYAHTPDALFKSLKTEGSRLVVVFGCGGNRDKGKRPEMGRIASEIADEVIVTSDNPRDEEPEAILDEIERGIAGGSANSHYRRVSDRSDAIKLGVSMLKPGDILLVAGKGHERYQEIAGKKYFFSDQEQIKKYMQQHCSGYPEKEKK